MADATSCPSVRRPRRAFAGAVIVITTETCHGTLEHSTMPPMRSMPRMLVVAMAAVAVLPLAACSTQQTPSTPRPDTASSPPGQPATDGGWHVVATFSGTGSKPNEETAPFTLKTGQWRVRFTVQPNSVGPVPFKWTEYRQGDPADFQHRLSSNSCASCDGEQINSDRNNADGAYYLRVLTSRPWKLTVEQAG